MADRDQIVTAAIGSALALGTQLLEECRAADAEIHAKAEQMIAAGAIPVVAFRFEGSRVEAALSIELDTGDQLLIGSIELHRKPSGTA